MNLPFLSLDVLCYFWHFSLRMRLNAGRIHIDLSYTARIWVQLLLRNLLYIDLIFKWSTRDVVA
jgi:hypothetical protein